MATLPNKYDLGGPGSFRSGRGYATADTSAIGEGMQRLGQGIANLGGDIGAIAEERRRQNRIASIPPADAGAKNALNDLIRNTIDPSTDYQAYGKTFDFGATKIRNQYAALIPDERDRAMWVNDFNSYLVGRRAEVLDTGVSRAKSAQVVSSATALDQYSAIYTDPNQSESERAQAGAHIQATIDESEKAGLISPETAYSWRNKYVKGSEETYAKLYVDAHKADYIPAGDPIQDVTSKIINAESGGDPNADNPRSSASGVGQFVDDTWVATIRKNRPEIAAGKTDKELVALKGDAALGREMTAAYVAENAGFLRDANLPVTEGNLYLAHFAGPEGAKKVLTADSNTSVEDLLGSKVIEANPQLRGKNAAWLINWASQTIGNRRGGPLPPNYDRLDPEQRQAVQDHIETVSNEQKVYVRAGIQDAVDNAPVAIQNTGTYSGAMPSAQQLISAYGAEGQQKYEAFKAAVDTSQNIYAMRNMTNSQIADMVQAAIPTSSGNDADLEVKRYSALSQAANSIFEQRKADPVGYVQRAFPSIGAAWQGVASGSATTQQAISQTVAAQQHIGIQPQDIQALPKDVVAKALAAFKADTLPERDRANAILGLFGTTTDPDQLSAIYHSLVKEGMPEYVGGAIRAAMRGDEAAANRLMSAAMVDPGKLPGELVNKESEIKEQIQSSLMDEGEVGDVYYGLTSGNLDGLQKAAADSTLLTRAVQMRLRQGESLADAVEAAGKDLYGDVVRVTGDGRVQTNILVPSGTDPKPIIDGLAASRIDVYNTLKSATEKAIAAAPAGDGAKAIISEAARNRIEDVMMNGYFIQTDNGYAYLDPYLGQPVSDEKGQPLLFDEKTVLSRGAPKPEKVGELLDPVARKMMGLDLQAQDPWKPMEPAN